MTDYRFELIQSGMSVARCESQDRDFALGEIYRYAFQYVQDGPVKIYEIIKRKRVLIADLQSGAKTCP